MRLPLLLTAAALLAGCSTVSAVRDAWTWDPSAPQDRARATVPPERAVAMTNRLAELQIRRIELRAQISAEPSVWARQRLYQELHDVGRELSPLERELIAASLR